MTKPIAANNDVVSPFADPLAFEAPKEPRESRFHQFQVKIVDGFRAISQGIKNTAMKPVNLTRSVCRWIAPKGKEALSMMNLGQKGFVYGTVIGQYGGAAAGAVIGGCIGATAGPLPALAGAGIGALIGFGGGMVGGGSGGAALLVGLNVHAKSKAKKEALIQERNDLRDRLNALENK